MVEVVPGHRGPGGQGRSDKYLSPGIRWLSAGAETRGLKSTKPHRRGEWSKNFKIPSVSYNTINNECNYDDIIIITC